MDEIKIKPGMNIPIRYIMDRETHHYRHPDSQMRSFIAVSGTRPGQFYLEPTELNLSREPGHASPAASSKVEGGVVRAL